MWTNIIYIAALCERRDDITTMYLEREENTIHVDIIKGKH